MDDSSVATFSDHATADASSVPSQKQEAKGVTFLMIEGIGCILLLCAGLIAGSSILFMRSILAAPPDLGVSPTDEAVVDGGVSIGDEVVVLEEATESQNPKSASDTLNFVAGGTSDVSVAGTPAISPITFALQITDNGEPIQSGFSFEEGITKIHAIFKYANLTPNYSWTQVWYHNGNEVLSTTQPWLENETGVFDYLIEAGGEPLPAGQWALEFYIEDELLAAGSFVIENQDQN